MSTRTQAGTFSRLMMAIAAVSALALSMIWLAGPVLATHVEPIFNDKNASCGELGDWDHEFKIEPVTAGDFSDPDSDFEVTITLHDTADGQTFDFAANLGVDAVFAKGGDQGNLYVYDPAEDADTGLHAPDNASGDYAGLSHISFCFDEPPMESEEQSVAESVAESEAESVAESAEESGEQSVEAGTGTPEESVSDGALSLNGVGPLPTIAFSLILLGSLGALAYANVKSVRS